MSGRLQSIDVLRGIAILGVLAIHCQHDAPGGFRQNIWFLPSFLADYGYMGVHLFVLLSGFCIHRKVAIEKANTGEYKLNWLQFWKRRFWRLYPPYLAAIAFSLFVAAARETYSFDNTAAFWDLFLHLTMLHNLTNFATELSNGVFWSLGMEEQLYLAYFALIVMFQRLPLRQTFAIVVSVTLLWRFFVSSSPAVPIGKVEIGYWHFWPTMFWLHWMLGAIAVDASLGNRTLPRWTHSLPLATVTMLFALFFNSNMFQLLDNTGHSSLFANLLPIASRPALQHVGELLAAISFFCLMNWMLDREATKWMTNPVANQLAKLGRISYSVYLVHIPILGFVSGCCEFESTGLQWIERTVLLWGVSILGGLVFHHAVEKWFINGVMPRYRRQARFVAATEA